MDSSKRAVESYWRSRLIDTATSDEDKVTPVYKLDEICELLRSSHASIVREVSQFILNRLDHKNPIVKHKALRLIKYAVVKSGSEFKREMQRHSVVVRKLLHHKGHPDALKGDALNKAVRDTAQETMSSIFSSEDYKVESSKDISKRIQGFGNTNFEMQSDGNKSFLSEVVAIGSASIKQGLSSFTQAHSPRKDESRIYKGPNLRRSLTTEIEDPDRYESQGSYGISKDVTGGPWVPDNLRVSKAESSSAGSKTREDKLLETIVTSGGVRLQPTRDAIQNFLGEATKLDAFALSFALESKLEFHLWQVRMKALCVLESILRKKEEEPFFSVASYFSENKEAVVRCSESPQASLREKSNKVLGLLGEQAGNFSSHVENPAKATTHTVADVRDLIDTGNSDDYYETGYFSKMHIDQSVPNLMKSNIPVIDELFGDSIGIVVSTGEQKNDDDPFSDVSFHTNDVGEKNPDNIFSGMVVDDKPSSTIGEVHDIFGPNSEIQKSQDNHKNVHELMEGLSIDKNKSGQKESVFGSLSESIFSEASVQPNHQQVSSETLNGFLNSQPAGANPNAMFPLGSCIPYPNIMFNPAYASQAINLNYGAMGNYFTQHQFLASVNNFQQIGSMASQTGYLKTNKEYSSALPDIFNPNVPNHTANTKLNSLKKEDTKAFDFISDHLAATRDVKRVA